MQCVELVRNHVCMSSVVVHLHCEAIGAKSETGLSQRGKAGGAKSERGLSPRHGW